jgi:Dolichyl-phosphate-mannose-protein mannosyltransferase
MSGHGRIRPRNDRLARVVAATLPALLALVAVAIAAASFASYAWVKARLDSFASDGNADLTHADFDAIVLRLRLAAAGVLVLAIAVHAGRRRIRGVLAELVWSAGTASSSLRRALAAAVRAESRPHLATLAFVTIAGFLIRLDFLFQPMRYDESVTYVHFASRPWYIALTNYTAPNNHVLHSLLVHLSTVVFGSAPWAIRFPAFVAGVLLVPASYVAARLLYGRDVALVGAALVASASVLIEFSTNARGYTIVALDFMLLLALATRLVESGNTAEWLLFALLGAIGFWTVPTMLYAYGTVVVWLGATMLARGRRLLVLRRLVPSVVCAAAVSLLLYAPIIASSGPGALVSNEFVGSRSWSSFTANLPDTAASVLRGWRRDVPLPLAVALGIAFGVALVLHRRLSRFALPPAVAAVVWIGPVLLAQRVVPYERVWLFLLPPYLITAAAGAVFLLRPLGARAAAATATALVLAVVLAGSLSGYAAASRSVYRSEDTSTFRDSDPVASLLVRRLRPGDKILVAPPADAVLEYQLDRRGLDSAGLLYWARPGRTTCFFVVVKTGPRDYPLPHVLADPRLRGVELAPARVVGRFSGSVVYETTRRATA